MAENRAAWTETTEETARPQGLSGAEAASRAAAGKGNRMPASADGGVAAIVRRNIFTLFNFLNLVLAALLVVVGSYRNLLFMGVVVSNAVIGLAQELRAKRTHDRLLLLSQGKVRTLRDGRETPVPPEELVLGDVVRLRRGDQVPADARVLAGRAEVNESLLTGESEPIPKAEGDALLSGSFITEGELTAELTAVGAESYAGKLQASARKVKRPRSELMASLSRVIRVVSVAIVPIGAALYLKQTGTLGLSTATAVTKTVAATLGMIPEGLILLTSVALAVGVVRLGRRNALVNELYGIENLARVDVLCLDKTGTLTTGQMSVTDVVPLGGASREAVQAAMRAFTAAFPGEDSPTGRALAAAFADGRDTDAFSDPPAQSTDAAQADDAVPEGRSAAGAGKAAGTGKAAPAARAAAGAIGVAARPQAALETVPFSSERKWSAARTQATGTLVLGAPETTLSAARADVLSLARKHAERGLRVLVLQRTASPLAGKTLPEALEPMALLLIGDTLRPEARDTLRYFAEQGVAVKVISGDSAHTVRRIAADAGLRDAGRALDCSALARPADYDTLAREYAVFGRVSPEDKRELVGALKRQGHAVAMIGDGVNDVPALKAADCSIAMAGGSDAASRVAQITLLDADFAVMPDIVLEGRRVINNITRASALFLVKNLFSFLLSAVLLVLPFAYPFAPIQLTLVSTLTIGLPGFVLALQPNRERVRGRFIANVLRRAVPGGVTVGLVCVGVMLAGQRMSLSEPVLSTLCTLVAAFSGLCVLALACLPMDALRAALTLSMAAGTALAVALFPGLFYLEPVTGGAVWLLIAALAAVLALLVGLTAAFGRPAKREAAARA
ncbi:MAG: HAD-IC family P-type ATPase [Clostridiales bacterium]|nr:HAD-IC family P-type ATPase [Clostridiales bacterium]